MFPLLARVGGEHQGHVRHALIGNPIGRRPATAALLVCSECTLLMDDRNAYSMTTQTGMKPPELALPLLLNITHLLADSRLQYCYCDNCCNMRNEIRQYAAQVVMGGVFSCCFASSPKTGPKH